MKIYFISGLGADERVFRALHLPGIEKEYIQWIKPIRKETLQGYSRRLLKQIDRKEEGIVLAGLSFGGIVAQEMSKLFPCKKVIIISSIKSHREIPWQFSLAKRSGLFHLLPIRKLQFMSKFAADYLFSTETRGESLLLKQIIADTSNEFLAWAAWQILHWENTTLPNNLTHIHGTKDRIFPYSNIKNCIPVKDGGHFMVLNKAEEVSSLILKAIDD